MKNYEVKIFENSLCIDHAQVTKEKAIQIQDCLNNKTVYLDKLRQQYKTTMEADEYSEARYWYTDKYNAMRLFCLDTGLLSFNDIEVMEFEVNSSF